MPRKIKINKKKVLKQPDEFISFGTKVFQFLKTYQKQFLIILPIIAIVIIVLSLSNYYIKQNNELAFTSLSKVLETEKDINKKTAELIKIRNKKFTDAAKYSAFYLAQIYYLQGDKEKAKKELEYAMNIKNDYFKASATNLYADILVSENKLNDALTTLDKNSVSTSPFKEELLFKKAQILEQLDKKEEAKKIYEQINKDYPDFYLIKVVQAKIK
ncbi:MAG: tetratricopeptide repeat protein [Proteobacteria bacterium]|nr:tetratricopeptide repeat protein [Pseudomonadota bacterium]